MTKNHWIIVIVVTILFGVFSVVQGNYTRESDILFRMMGAFVLNYAIASTLTKPQANKMEVSRDE